METVIIREERSNDLNNVYNVNNNAFQQEDEAKLVNALRGSDAFIPQLSLVATLKDTIVGYILFTKVTIGTNTSLALAPLSVHSDYQRKGIGEKLIKAGLKRAEELGFQSVIVLGHEHYYSRFSFLPASSWNIESPFNAPDGAFRAIELVPDALKDVSGLVMYDKAFLE
ncbi:hypothetical protein DFQ28_006620 [Apophysomyces sp. BC1034]|nr:hypothetical protein DFQ30_003367 [Apophysomyces sp. BC1015]KAG0182995.1 hypothetical protein DFQ29_000806 [Apophysomyces sp. BC1021]KAG0194771.1 hypothetical protein DFQ28_006620 [Apophysomyces sp. BC1034]